MSPEWYRTTNYRRRLVRWPRQILAEFGLILPAEVELRVEDSNQKCRFMVLPARPEGTENWTEEQLAESRLRAEGERLHLWHSHSDSGSNFYQRR
jgi:thiocyanate hydrolase subunit gamma